MKRKNSARLCAMLTLSLLSASALAESNDTGTSAEELGLSDYRYFMIYPHLERAFRAQKENDETTAIAEFRHVLQQAPDNVPLTQHLAEAYRHFGHNKQARQLLKDLLKRHPGNKRLQQQLEAIPYQAEPMATVEQLRLAQKLCDAEPTSRCRSDIGQSALTLKQLTIAKAQLDDGAFAASPQGQQLENNLLQRAIYLKVWQMVDEIFTRKQQQHPLSEAEKKQWFSALLNGQLDDHIHTLQAQGIFNSPQDQLQWASALATRNEQTKLENYLAEHQPRFDDEAQEKNWLYLIARYGNDPLHQLVQFAPQFAANRRYVANAVLPSMIKSGDYAAAQRVLDTLPEDEMLTERYMLSVASHNTAQSLALARRMYQRDRQNMQLLDQLTWQLTEAGQSREASELLLQRYPFDASTPQAGRLTARLFQLFQAHPEQLTPALLNRLTQPLPTPALRQLQSQLPGVGDDCRVVRRLLGDMSDSYDAYSWRRLASCYRGDLPGVALFALQQAEKRQPDAYQRRAVAYQAYAVENYASAMQGWRSLALSDMSDADLIAAANTAQAAGDVSARDRWLDEAQKRGKTNSEAWWWLHAQRYLPAQPKLALADLTRAIEIQPTVRALTSRADLYRLARNKQNNISDLRQALALEPGNGATQAALGYALWRNGDYLESRAMLEQALKSTPDDPQLPRQLMYVNERLDDRNQTQLYARQLIDETNDAAQVTPLTPAQNQELYNIRRLHENIARRWTFSIDSTVGLRSGTMSSASPQSGGPTPGKSYRSYGQMEAEYRLGRNMLVKGDTLAVYSRVFGDTGSSNVMMPVKNPTSGTGIRWKPFYNFTLFFAVEQQFSLANHANTSDTMLRASASFLNNGKFSDEWHPNGSGWLAQNLYLDAAQYVRRDIQSATADYRISWHQKVAQGQTLEPYAHLQINSDYNGKNRDDRRSNDDYISDSIQVNQLGGIGVRWNIWTGETRYNAWPHKISLGLEYQRTFSTINQAPGERNNAFFTLGVHW